VAAKFLRLRRPAEGDGQPARRSDLGEARLWHFGAALAAGFAAAALGLAGLTWLAWSLLHHPRLPQHGTITLHDAVGVLQLVFASVAGAGALVALIVAYRRQKIAEADSVHDRTRVFNERFTAIAAQLGDAQPAVRLAGVHAMAGLADDWQDRHHDDRQDHRQTCVDVLCAYLRMPYEPDPGEDASTEKRLAFQASREVRHTVIRVITAHLNGIAPVSWRGLNFDFTGVVFDGGNFGGAKFSGGKVSFTNAIFSGGTVAFTNAIFSGGTVYFGAAFSGGLVVFDGATFSGGLVVFDGATFSGGTVDFGAAFSGGTVAFTNAIFSGGTVGFGSATLPAAWSASAAPRSPAERSTSAPSSPAATLASSAPRSPAARSTSAAPSSPAERSTSAAPGSPAARSTSATPKTGRIRQSSGGALMCLARRRASRCQQPGARHPAHLRPPSDRVIQGVITPVSVNSCTGRDNSSWMGHRLLDPPH